MSAGQAVPRILSIAGSDSGGGAGIQADIKTISALGGYAMTAVTAVTVQNTLGVSGIAAVPPETIAAQIESVMSDLGADAIKTGMLGDAAVIEAVVGVLERQAHDIPLVVDPVMVAKGGARLLAEEAQHALSSRLMPLATLVTPNVPEAEALTGLSIDSPETMAAAGRRLLDRGCRAVLMKGGHLPGEMLFDLLVTPEGQAVFSSPRIETRHTHGTGCTLASAIATWLGRGAELEDACNQGRDYVRRAIAAAPGFGHGQGPLGHWG